MIMRGASEPLTIQNHNGFIASVKFILKYVFFSEIMWYPIVASMDLSDVKHFGKVGDSAIRHVSIS